MRAPDSRPRPDALTGLRRIPKLTWAGLIATALLALIGLASSGFWGMVLMIALVVLITAAYGFVFRRHTWMRLPRKRSTAAIGAGIAFAVLIGSSSAYGVGHPTTHDAPVAVAPAASSTSVGHAPAAHTSTPTRRPHTRTTPTPTPTPVVTTQMVTTTTPVPLGFASVNDAHLPSGTSRVTTAGAAGVMTTTFQVTIVDGVETGRQQVSQQVTTPPVTQVTSVGTYVAPPPPPVAAPAPAAPVAPGGGATALCRDGTFSYAAHHQGACSYHGGVAQFYK